MAWIAALDQENPRTHDLSLLGQLVIDSGGDPARFQSLENFTPFGSRLRYDDEPDALNLDRPAWNQLCADLLRVRGLPAPKNEDATRAQKARLYRHSRFTSKQQLFACFRRFLYEPPQAV